MPAARTPHCCYAFTPHLHAQASDVPPLWPRAVTETREHTSMGPLGLSTRMAHWHLYLDTSRLRSGSPLTNQWPSRPQLSTTVQVSPVSHLHPPSPPPSPPPPRLSVRPRPSHHTPAPSTGAWQVGPRQSSVSPRPSCGVGTNLAPPDLSPESRTEIFKDFSALQPGTVDEGGASSTGDVDHTGSPRPGEPHITPSALSHLSRHHIKDTLLEALHGSEYGEFFF